MILLISADIEGVSGVVHPEQVRPGHSEYEKARLWMTKEANAAIRGAFKGGVTEVYLNDSHSGYRNMLPDKLDKRALLITGKPRQLGMMSGLELGVDAASFLGHHSRASGLGVLAHTTNSFAFAEIIINDIPMGEPSLYGLLAGEYKVPIIFGSGDQYLKFENSEFFPEALWAETKYAMGHQSALSKTLEASCELIESQMEKAVKNFLKHPPHTHSLFTIKEKTKEAPYHCVIKTNGPVLADLFSILPTIERKDSTTLSFKEKSIENIVRIINVFSAMASSLR